MLSFQCLYFHLTEIHYFLYQVTVKGINIQRRHSVTDIQIFPYSFMFDYFQYLHPSYIQIRVYIAFAHYLLFELFNSELVRHFTYLQLLFCCFPMRPVLPHSCCYLFTSYFAIFQRGKYLIYLL